MKSNSTNMTRRHMLQMTGILGAGALLSGCTTQQSGEQDGAAAVELTLYDPSGSIEITQLFAPRLDTIEGKTIAFVSDDAWEDARTFELIKSEFAEKYPSVNIITQDNFIHGIEAITRADNGLGEAMIEKGVDAVIVGNAG